jgi:hypothetical protein
MPSLPGINHQRAVKAFEKFGFWVARQGKHFTMTNGKRLIPCLLVVLAMILILNNSLFRLLLELKMI